MGERPPRLPGRRAWWMATALVACFAAAPVPHAAPLSGLETVRSIYTRILDADFGGANTAIAACAGAPREACDVLQATRVWWQILFDIESPARDPEFLRAVDVAIASTEAWTTREPRNAEAWFYLGGAYGARVQFRAYRKEYLGAARDGKRVKEAMERALALDPTIVDANFGLGLYEYYADIAPAAAKFLRMLLFLPGGDRAVGLKRMTDAREHGAVMAGEATFQLHVIDLWYERQFTRALGLLRDLERGHPRNPYFVQLVADVQDVYFHDRTASLDTWQRLLDLGTRGAVNEAALATARARFGAAQQLNALYETDAAIELLRALVASSPTAPFGVLSKAHLSLGHAFDRVGDRDRALTAYAAAAALAPAGDPQGVRSAAHQAQRAPAPPEAATRAYRLSLEGWRALERKDVAAAERALSASVALRGDDPVARYRLAQVRLASRDEDAALRDLELVIAAAPTDAPTFHARACVDAAQVLERRGQRDRALALYDRAASIFGAASATKEAAARAAGRLRGAKR